MSRTHWFSSEMTERSRRELTEHEGAPPELLVISPIKDWTRTSCPGGGGLLVMQDDGPLCLGCAGLDHLVYLPRGNAGLTRRAHRHSAASAVVVRYSRARCRYEGQGLMVEEAALRQAEQELGLPSTDSTG